MIPNRNEEFVVTAGRVTTGVLGQEGEWHDFIIQSGSAGLNIVMPHTSAKDYPI